MKVSFTKRDLHNVIHKIVTETLNKEITYGYGEYLSCYPLTEGLTCTYSINKIKGILNRKYDMNALNAKIGSFDENRNSTKSKYSFNKSFLFSIFIIFTLLLLLYYFLFNEIITFYIQPFRINANTTQDTDNWYCLTIEFVYGVKNNQDIVKDMIHTCDACGWYLSDVTYRIMSEGGQKLYVMNKNNLDLYDTSLQNRNTLFKFRAKFNAEYKNTSIPEYLYHIAPLRVVNKIKSQGLTPRDNGRIASHPERVYLFIDYPHNWKEIADNFRLSNKEEKYCLLSIDKRKLNKNIKFYFDSNVMQRNAAIYTNEPISPNAIELIDLEK